MKKISVSEEDVYKEIYIESEIAKLWIKRFVIFKFGHLN